MNPKVKVVRILLKLYKDLMTDPCNQYSLINIVLLKVTTLFDLIYIPDYKMGLPGFGPESQAPKARRIPSYPTAPLNAIE